jgi:hypothetical protein
MPRKGRCFDELHAGYYTPLAYSWHSTLIAYSCQLCRGHKGASGDGRSQLESGRDRGAAAGCVGTATAGKTGQRESQPQPRKPFLRREKQKQLQNRPMRERIHHDGKSRGFVGLHLFAGEVVTEYRVILSFLSADHGSTTWLTLRALVLKDESPE